MKKIILIAVVLLIIFLGWLFAESSKPLPGQKITDLGRGHVPVGTKVDYNSNPPTSGKHYEEWVRKGMYDEERDDRNLVHSLEHGYIVMYYKCTKVPETEASSSANLDQCQSGKEKLAEVYEKKGQHKLIVIPRSNLDTNFAVTAWDYLDKFNDFDENRIEKFIDVHLEMGPEKTME